MENGGEVDGASPALACSRGLDGKLGFSRLPVPRDAREGGRVLGVVRGRAEALSYAAAHAANLSR